jgi:hypothetical protein
MPGPRTYRFAPVVRDMAASSLSFGRYWKELKERVFDRGYWGLVPARDI